jgi:hypothetical protein
MTSDDLTIEQAERMKAVVGRHLNYLGQLTRRMDHREFDPNDALYVSARKAYNAIHEFNVRLHSDGQERHGEAGEAEVDCGAGCVIAARCQDQRPSAHENARKCAGKCAACGQFCCFP